MEPPGCNRFDFPRIIIGGRERKRGRSERRGEGQPLFTAADGDTSRVTMVRAVRLRGGLYNNSRIDAILSAFRFRITH